MRYPYLIYALEIFILIENEAMVKSVDAFLGARHNNQELDGSLGLSPSLAHWRFKDQTDRSET